MYIIFIKQNENLYFQFLLLSLGVLDYHMEDLLRREDFILSTRFARMDPTWNASLSSVSNAEGEEWLIGGSVKAHASKQNSGQGQC